ncbi:DUF3833 domain-containing protein [uncultured Shimia sp.]|uniref:DUF3833 domain-containing protein n=1 Tax=uncultured Shimia sp. TaxID=573152 RepID=UPI00261B94EE|nr:DUF3833 domain-containing protein [uncultured Shimia sp.]
MRRFVMAGALALLAACGRPTLDQDKLSNKELNLEEYFSGRTVAYGQFQDSLGRVSQRFKVTIDGRWDGKVLTLDERFVYSDGGKDRRVWSLTKTGAETWQGTAEGVQGVATGVENGDTFNWRYTIDLPKREGDGSVRVSFDDWMWLLEDGRLLNKAYMSKAGITLGQVIIFFEKK